MKRVLRYKGKVITPEQYKVSDLIGTSEPKVVSGPVHRGMEIMCEHCEHIQWSAECMFDETLRQFICNQCHRRFSAI